MGRQTDEEGGSVLDVLDGPDVAVILRGGVRVRSHAWEFVRWFADAWMGRPVEPEDGCTADELTAVEADMGFELPATLREGYALFGRRDDLLRQQDPLVRPSGLFVDDALGGVLVFRRENQDCAFWGIPLSQVVSLFRFDGHHRCGGQAASAVSYSAGLR
ncbi:hypothetical protein [Streptomyces sp. NBC_00582]|uniref:hypothetical protein n=1 Tax=Streptomyces sp. NBC_00582 TaxID=2975783 RepID=UPI002E804A14|nr:hypothetical protein [Streptomyces sp. NBC_00582]WUB59250.1 SMI1/KNR4 family protein [Streptomyces sp. NBC_00582]